MKQRLAAGRHPCAVSYIFEVDTDYNFQLGSQALNDVQVETTGADAACKAG